DARGAVSRYVGAGVMLASAVAALVAVVQSGGDELTKLAEPAAGMGTVEAIGREMLGPGLIAFQLAGLLLLVGVVGAMAVARGRQAPKQTPAGRAKASDAAREAAREAAR